MASRVPVMEDSAPFPALEEPATAPRAAKSRNSMSTPTKTPAGIIQPPPDVRCVVDKTAEFVAQNGVEFEQKILSNEKRNPTFNFLKSKDAYHSYYQQRILEFIDQGQSPKSAAKPSGNADVKQPAQ